MSDLWHGDGPGEDDVAQLTASNSVDVRVAAMDLLARRDHSRKELKQKLKKRFDDESIIEEQLDRLAEEKLQSDARYAESFVRQRFHRGHGPLRIRQEMRQKGIPDADIAIAMDAEEYDWYSSAQSVLERKFGPETAVDMKDEARRIRFMQYRGFSLEHFRDRN